MMTALFRLPMLRSLRSPQFYATLGLAIVATIVLSLVFRHRSHGADQALLGPCSTFVVPLAVYSVTGVVLGSGGLRASVEPLVSFGGSRLYAVAATVMWAVLLAGCLGALLPGLAVAIAHGSSDPPLLRDLVVTLRVGLLAGSAMAAVCCFGALFGKNGGGRGVVFFLLWAFGAGENGLAVVSPSAHLRGLLGGVPPLEMTARASQGVLFAMTLALLVAASLRAAAPRR